MSLSRLFFCFAFGLLFSAGTDAAVATRRQLVGAAQNTTIQKHPYQLGLQFYGNQDCGAALLSAQVAVTAAHCTDGKDATTLSVRAGSTRRNAGGQLSYVDFIIMHPKFNRLILDYDVAILRLSSKITRTPAMPIALQPNGTELSAGVQVNVTGWRTDELNPNAYSDTLQVATVPVRSNEECLLNASPLTSRMLCAGDLQTGTNACVGDSGAPLVRGSHLVGIESSNVGCQLSARPTVYTKISNPEIYTFITKSMT